MHPTRSPIDPLGLFATRHPPTTETNLGGLGSPKSQQPDGPPVRPQWWLLAPAVSDCDLCEVVIRTPLMYTPRPSAALPVPYSRKQSVNVGPPFFGRG
jgi:hypothetical protein